MAATARVQICFLLLLMLLFIKEGAAQVFHFPDPIKHQPPASCGLQNLEGQWSVQGKVKLTSQDVIMRDPTVIFKTSHELCSIDLAHCSDVSAPTTVDACYCTGNANGEFNLFVRQRPRVTDSSLMLQADMPSRDIFNMENVSVSIGVLPRIYDVASVTYNVDDGDTNILLPVQNITVTDNEFVTLKFCVINLSAGSDIQVSVGRQKIISSDSCVEFTKKYDFTSEDFYAVTVSYIEKSGCERKGTFSLSVQEQKDDVLAVHKKSCLVTSPYLPDILPSGTCFADKNSCPLEIVTLTNGQQIACDTKTDNGGWVIVQRRSSADVDFQRDWKDYQDGFGDMDGNFWFGLENIHRLCVKVSCQLRVQIVFNKTEYYAMYNTFSLSGAAESYAIHVSGFSGTAGDALTGSVQPMNGMKFTTKDIDNDIASFHCAVTGRNGGWWYHKCGLANLNGLWGSKAIWKAPSWWITSPGYNPVDYTVMMVRPRGHL